MFSFSAAKAGTVLKVGLRAFCADDALPRWVLGPVLDSQGQIRLQRSERVSGFPGADTLAALGTGLWVRRFHRFLAPEGMVEMLSMGNTPNRYPIWQEYGSE